MMAMKRRPKAITEERVLAMMRRYNLNMQTLMNNADKEQREIAARVTVYGIEAAMLKGQGFTSDPIANEVARRVDTTRIVEQAREEVLLIQSFVCTTARNNLGWQNDMILQLTLDGLKVREISEEAPELNMRPTTVHKRQTELAKIITNHILSLQSVQEVQVRTERTKRTS